MEDNEDREQPPGMISRWLSWRPTSRADLKSAEEAILNRLSMPYQASFIKISNNNRIRLLTCGTKDSSKVPIVMLHGFASGVALWVHNLKAISGSRPVYAIDLLGFGRSSRPEFPATAEDIEETFVKSVDECVEQLQLKKFILLGHSFGAYLSAAYALRHPSKLHALLLCDPWGFPERMPNNEREIALPAWIRVVATLLQPFNPLAGLRALGPWGPSLIQRFRPDLQRKYVGVVDDNSVFNYIYHCNAQNPSGETAFKNLTIPYGWAKKPMINRVELIEQKLPIYLIYGSRSWIDSGIGFRVKYLRPDSDVHIEIIKGAGHHVYADRPTEFNGLVNKICDSLKCDPPDESPADDADATGATSGGPSTSES